MGIFFLLRCCGAAVLLFFLIDWVERERGGERVPQRGLLGWIRWYLKKSLQERESKTDPSRPKTENPVSKSPYGTHNTHQSICYHIHIHTQYENFRSEKNRKDSLGFQSLLKQFRTIINHHQSSKRSRSKDFRQISKRFFRKWEQSWKNSLPCRTFMGTPCYERTLISMPLFNHSRTLFQRKRQTRLSLIFLGGLLVIE